MLSVVLCFRCVKTFWLAGCSAVSHPVWAGEIPVLTPVEVFWFLWVTLMCRYPSCLGHAWVISSLRSSAFHHRDSVSYLCAQTLKTPFQKLMFLMWTQRPQECARIPQRQTWSYRYGTPKAWSWRAAAGAGAYRAMKELSWGVGKVPW